jgi:hypothetical protein
MGPSQKQKRAVIFRRPSFRCPGTNIAFGQYYILHSACNSAVFLLAVEMGSTRDDPERNSSVRFWFLFVRGTAAPAPCCSRNNTDGFGLVAVAVYNQHCWCEKKHPSIQKCHGATAAFRQHTSFGYKLCGKTFLVVEVLSRQRNGGKSTNGPPLRRSGP